MSGSRFSIGFVSSNLLFLQLAIFILISGCNHGFNVDPGNIFVDNSTVISSQNPIRNNNNSLVGIEYLGTHPSLGHQIGFASGTAWAVLSSSNPGFLTFGPYTSSFQNGVYKAAFNLSVDNNLADDSTIGYLDVYDTVSKKVLARRDFRRREFKQANVSQSFDLTFNTQGSNQLEFRIFYFGYSFLSHFSTVITQIESTGTRGVLLRYLGTDPALGHQLGYPVNSKWAADAANGAGYMIYGPYTNSVPPGSATASFRLSVDNNSGNNDSLLRLEAYNVTANQILATRVVRRQDFTAAMTPQDFDIVFELASAAMMEFRVYTYGLSHIEHLQTVIYPDRLTLGSLWDQQAHFEPRTGNSMGAVSSMIVHDGAWYAFFRQFVRLGSGNTGPCTATTGLLGLQTAVSRSTDHGATWSDPVVVASVNGAGPDACAVTDGGAFFDAEEDVWHMLYQCQGTSGGWNLCHYTRAGSNPMGPFVADSHNPVIRGGQLWSQICSGPGKACPPGMGDEGTVQIIRKTGGYFYATFHGAILEGQSVKGARGVARTKDFLNWEVSGADLPGNAMLSAQDCNPWSVNWKTGGCIGIGHATMLRSGGFNYMLAEGSDMSLLCTQGQNWVFGLMRSVDLSPSGSWQNYTSNPFVTNLKITPNGCGVQYQSFFRDRGEVFLHFWYYSSDNTGRNQILQLVNAPGSPQIIVK